MEKFCVRIKMQILSTLFASPLTKYESPILFLKLIFLLLLLGLLDLNFTCQTVFYALFNDVGADKRIGILLLFMDWHAEVTLFMRCSCDSINETYMRNEQRFFSYVIILLLYYHRVEMGREEKEGVLLSFGLSRIKLVAQWSTFLFFTLTNIITDKEVK
jgi:hypothetical protein